MFKSSYQLCTIFNIPIKLDISLIILIFFIVSNYGNPLYGIAAGITLLLSITLHELGHSLAAMAFGCRVRDITLMMMGGCATMLSMPNKAWQELLMAAAGPAVSLFLAITGLLVPQYLPALNGTLNNFIFQQIGLLNGLLFVFNLLPAFPMDGGRILRALLQQFFMTRLRATWVASRIGRVLAGAMMFFAICNLLGITLPAPPFHGDIGKLFWYLLSHGGFIKLLIGWMIFKAADREYQMVLMEEGAHRSAPFNPFAPWNRHEPPSDNGKAIVSLPPYERGGTTRVDVHKEP